MNKQNTTQDFKVTYQNIENHLQQEFLIIQCQCVLCGEALKLQHTILPDETIREEAHCPRCQIRARAKVFTLN